MQFITVSAIQVPVMSSKPASLKVNSASLLETDMIVENCTI